MQLNWPRKIPRLSYFKWKEPLVAGANVGMIFMMAVEQEYDELNFCDQGF